MESLRELIREIHRRSLWQVLGIFLAASWGVLQVVEVLTETAGLPDWTPTMALVALLIGLPVCIATAFVQEGMPGGGTAGGGGDHPARTSSGELMLDGEAEPEDAPAPVNLAAGTGSLDRPSTRPSRARRLLTWRNAILGGVGAFSLLGFSVFAYFVMWTTGIGPVGNLVAQGVIEEGERVVLADFADGTGAGFADAVTEALRVDFLEASVLELVEAPEIASTLRLMQAEPGSKLTAERALEVAQRTGVAAVIDGEVTQLGTGYLLTANLRDANTGRSLASFRQTAGGPDELILSTDRLSQDIREKSGESLRAIRGGTPLEQATTSSLEALKLYSEASDVFYESNDGARTAEFLELALAEDSTFAMGWRMLAIALQSGIAPTRWAEALSNAFRYRDRLQPMERYLAEALYYTNLTTDFPKVIEAYRNVLRVEPGEFRTLNNLALIYQQHYYDFRSGEELIREAIAGPRPAVQHYGVLIGGLLSEDRVAEAVVALRDAEERYPGTQSWTRSRVLLAQGDVQAAADHARRRAEDMSLPVANRALQTAGLGLLEYHAGRLDEGRRLFLRAESMARQVGGMPAWRHHLETTYAEALLGDPAWAREHFREGLSSVFSELPPVGRGHAVTATFLASTGDGEGAQLVIDDFRASIPPEWQGPSDLSRLEQASLYARVAAGDATGAVEAIEELLLAWGCSDACWSFDRARMHDRLGDYGRALELYELVPRRPENIASLRPEIERLYVMLRLGPLYEELGDNARAVEAYQRIVDQWADGDARGLETVARFRERIAALGG